MELINEIAVAGQIIGPAQHLYHLLLKHAGVGFIVIAIFAGGTLLRFDIIVIAIFTGGTLQRFCIVVIDIFAGIILQRFCIVLL